MKKIFLLVFILSIFLPRESYSQEEEIDQRLFSLSKKLGSDLPTLYEDLFGIYIKRRSPYEDTTTTYNILLYVEVINTILRYEKELLSMSRDIKAEEKKKYYGLNKSRLDETKKIIVKKLGEIEGAYAFISNVSTLKAIDKIKESIQEQKELVEEAIDILESSPKMRIQ